MSRKIYDARYRAKTTTVRMDRALAEHIQFHLGEYESLKEFIESASIIKLSLDEILKYKESYYEFDAEDTTPSKFLYSLDRMCETYIFKFLKK